MTEKSDDRDGNFFEHFPPGSGGARFMKNAKHTSAINFTSLAAHANKEEISSLRRCDGRVSPIRPHGSACGDGKRCDTCQY
ncbi:hypothetical protein [Yersinia pekkanenii]|uniref:hypothetical protein n=1 Tax=Yersinia pekkanenii TaxID=1288385 RepID=UPI0012E02554|nr:hypothetical protein [Yersinia pekkanenii]